MMPRRLRYLFWSIHFFIKCIPFTLRKRFDRRYQEVETLRFQIGDIVKVIYGKDVLDKSLGVKGEMGVIQQVNPQMEYSYVVKFRDGVLPSLGGAWLFRDNDLKPIWTRRRSG